jgi:hypothetical protein
MRNSLTWMLLVVPSAALCAGIHCSNTPDPGDQTTETDGGDEQAEALDGSGADGSATLDAPSDGAATDAQTEAGPVDPVWPNAASSANSDPWIAEHHAEIREMRPRILALNFVNARSNDQMLAAMQQAIDAVKEASRYHGYADPSAPPFLIYEVKYAIDLRDSTPDSSPYFNATRMPRENPPSGWPGMDYGGLFTQQFADEMKIADPDNPQHNLRLCELINRGMIHEVWMYADEQSDEATAAAGKQKDVSIAEILELKPYYDEQRKRIDADMNRCAGNGCFRDEDEIPVECTRTVRIGFMNSSRGPGCYLESLSHGFESIGAGNPYQIRYLSRYFMPFGNFDLDKRYHADFQSWYQQCPYAKPCLTFPDDPNAASVTYAGKTQTGTFAPYDPVCGNVHFAPNGRQDYDMKSPATVLTSCETYRQANSQKREFTSEVFKQYASVSDCMGPWLVWWRQNFPGLDNLSLDDNGKPMLNWWPFIFY